MEYEAVAEIHGEDYLYDKLTDRLAAIVTKTPGMPLREYVGFPTDPVQLEQELAGAIPFVDPWLAAQQEQPVKKKLVTQREQQPIPRHSHEPIDWAAQHPAPERPAGCLNVTDAANYLGCSTATISLRIRQGLLPFTRTTGVARWIAMADLDRVRVNPRGRPPISSEVEEVMDTDDDELKSREIRRIPAGTQWVSFRGIHPDAIVFVERATSHSIKYRAVRPGASQGPIDRGKRHRIPRQRFLERFKPYQRDDWLAATDTTTRQEDQDLQVVEDTKPQEAPSMTWSYDISTEPDAEPVMEPAKPQPATKRTSVEQNELNDIVDLWRSEIPVAEIAREYNINLPTTHRLIAQAVGQDEYALRSIVEYLRRIDGEPVRPSRLSQMTAARTGEFLDRVLNLGVKLGKIKVWPDGKYRLVGLPDAVAPPDHETVQITTDEQVSVESGQWDITAQEEPFVIEGEDSVYGGTELKEEPVTEPAQSYAVESFATRTHEFKVTIRRIVVTEDSYVLQAENVVKAAQIASDGLQANEEVWNISVNE